MLLRPIVVALLFAAGAAAQSPLFDQVPEMMQAISRITGWKVKRNVPSELLSKEQFSKMVDQGAKEAEHDKSTRATELTLQMFGLVPWDFNLARESADLIEEQAAAFYDIRKKRLYVLESTQDSAEQRVALAHELAHALADQQYGLQKYIYSPKDDDAVTARQAVVEGQASWLSWAYMSQRTGGRAEVPRLLLDQLAAVGASGDNFPVLAQTPLYMRESLTFPYTEGMRFQDAVYRRLGSGAFDRVFRSAPLSTQEILHPEAYEDNLTPAHPRLPDLKVELGSIAREYRELLTGDVGEFDFSAILRQYGDARRGAEIASHWRGGEFRLLEQKKTKAPMLEHVSEWENAEAAGAFFVAYLDTMKAKWKRFDVETRTSQDVLGSGDRGKFTLRLRGTRVEAVEGIMP